MILARLAELRNNGGTPCELAMARVNDLLAKLKENLSELETSVGQSLDASRSTLKRWRRETRELVRRLGELRPTTA